MAIIHNKQAGYGEWRSVRLIGANRIWVFKELENANVGKKGFWRDYIAQSNIT